MRHLSRGRLITRWVLVLSLLLGLAVALGGAWAWRASGLELLEWGYPRLAAQSLAGSLGEMLTLTARMLERLRRGDTIAAEIAAVERLTEETDSLLLVALGELYEEEAEAAHPLPLLRWSHLLDRLETALDGAGRIATILDSLVIKHA